MKRLAVILFFCLAMVSVAYGDLKDFSSSVKDKASSAAKETAQTAADDGSITAEVKAKIMATASLKDEKIEVSTKEGVVTLTGTVKTPQAKGTATKIAKAVKGVKSVDNKLVIEKQQKRQRNR